MNSEENNLTDGIDAKKTKEIICLLFEVICRMDDEIENLTEFPCLNSGRLNEIRGILYSGNLTENEE